MITKCLSRGQLQVRGRIPALLGDLDIVESNIQEMAGVCARAGVDLVSHVKTLRGG
jgi:D-serine deaminase-like pyridoxal phosphate-dependent protein